MLEAFLGRRFDLAALAQDFDQEHGRRYRAERQLVSAHVTTPDLATAYTIAEFMLNLLPIPHPPPKRALADYVRTHFERPNGSFRFSCDQDFIQIRKCN